VEVSDAALLLGGYGTDRRRLHPLRDALFARGVAAEVWPYRPVGSIAGLADELAARVSRLPGERIHLVGHSFGGIVCGAAALRQVDRLATVTTVNTPWRGTWASYTGSGAIVEALRWRSEELRAMRARLAAHHTEPDGPRWLLLSAVGDLAVPATSALRPGARGERLRRRTVRANGHSVSLLAPRLVAAVVEHVAGHADPTAGDGAAAGGAAGQRRPR
jgi:pimeloyl-ACP methyl ester carboxylesterase